MMFVTDPIPEHFTFWQRVRRWAMLMQLHPSLNRFNVDQFLSDLPASFASDMQTLQPIVAQQMETYKQRGLLEHCTKLGITTAEGVEQCRRDCDYVMEKYFKGDWGFPCMLEYIYLHNAIQETGPEDWDEDTQQRFQTVSNPVTVIFQLYEATMGSSNFNYRLEDERNATPRER